MVEPSLIDYTDHRDFNLLNINCLYFFQKSFFFFFPRFAFRGKKIAISDFFFFFRVLQKQWSVISYSDRLIFQLVSGKVLYWKESWLKIWVWYENICSKFYAITSTSKYYVACTSSSIIQKPYLFAWVFILTLLANENFNQHSYSKYFNSNN